MGEAGAAAHDAEGCVWVEEGVTQDGLGEVVDAFGGDGVGGPFCDQDGEPVVGGGLVLGFGVVDVKGVIDGGYVTYMFGTV